MKRHVIAFFVIALISELVTTWVQGLRTVSDVSPLICYSSFKDLFFDRLLVWTVLFLTLTGIWTLLARRLSKS